MLSCELLRPQGAGPSLNDPSRDSVAERGVCAKGRSRSGVRCARGPPVREGRRSKSLSASPPIPYTHSHLELCTLYIWPVPICCTRPTESTLTRGPRWSILDDSSAPLHSAQSHVRRRHGPHTSLAGHAFIWLFLPDANESVVVPVASAVRVSLELVSVAESTSALDPAQNHRQRLPRDLHDLSCRSVPHAPLPVCRPSLCYLPLARVGRERFAKGRRA